MAVKIREKFSLPQNISENVAQQNMAYHLSQGSLEIVFSIKDAFSLKEDFFKTEEMYNAAIQGVLSSVARDATKNASNIKNIFSLKEDIFSTKEIHEKLLNCLDECFFMARVTRNPNSFSWIKENFPLKKETLSSYDFIISASRGIMECIQTGIEVEDTLLVDNTFELSKLFFSKKDVKDNVSYAIEEYFEDYIYFSDSDFEDFYPEIFGYIYDKFSFSDKEIEKLFNIAKKIFKEKKREYFEELSSYEWDDEYEDKKDNRNDDSDTYDSFRFKRSSAGKKEHRSAENFTENTVDELYKILEISPTSSVEEVKKQYYILARKYHPDVSTSSDALERMKKINDAYDRIVRLKKKS